MEVCTPSRAGAWALAALLLLAGTVTVVPTAKATHFSASCGGLAPASNGCSLTIPSAHGGGIDISLSTFGPPPFTGRLRVTLDDGIGAPDVVTCGPYLLGFALGGCSGSPNYVPNQTVDVTVQAQSAAGFGPGAGAWGVTVTN